MRKIYSVVKKEIRSYFNSPIAFIVIVFFITFASVWLFIIQKFLLQNVATLRGYFSIMPVIFIILLPALTMRSWAEERSSGTEELLLTLPFSEYEVVLGKYFASLFLLAVMIILTFPVPWTLFPLGNFEKGQILSQYIGMFLLGSGGIAIGQFISSVSKNQIVAFIFSTLVLIILTLVGQAGSAVGLPDSIVRLLNYISLDHHFSSFTKGLLDSRDIMYFVIMIFFFIYSNIKVLILRKWK